MANKFDIHKGTQTVLDDTLYCPATISPTVFKDINAKYRGIFELRVGGRVLNEGGVPWLVGERNFVDNKRVFLNEPDGTAYVDLYTAGGKFIHRWKLFFETYEIVATVEREYEKTFGLRVSTYGSIVIVDTKRPEQERRSPEGGTGVVRNKNYAETKAILEDPTIEAFIDSYRNDHGGVAFEFVDRFIMRKIRNMATNLNLALDRSKAKLVHESVYSMNDFTNKIKRAFMAYDNMSEEELAEIGITDYNLFDADPVRESRSLRGRMLKEESGMKKDVFTYETFEIDENGEEDFDSSRESNLFYDFDEAVEAAKKEVAEQTEPTGAFVFIGEYEKDNGEVWGDPVAVLSISNTREYKADEYVGGSVRESRRRPGRMLKEDVGEKYELTDEMTKLEKVEAVIRKVASLVSMDSFYPNIYDTNARTRSGDVLRQISDEDEKKIKFCIDIFREAEENKNAKPKHIFGITVPPHGEVGIAFNTNSEIAKILLDKVPECKAVRTGQFFRKDDGMDVRLSADFIGDYFNKIMSALDDFRDSRTVMPRCSVKEDVKRVSLDVSVSDEWDEDGKKYMELVVKKNGKKTPVNVCVVFTDKGEHLDTVFYNTEKNNEDLTENEVAEELDVSVGDIKKLVEKAKIKAMKEFE